MGRSICRILTGMVLLVCSGLAAQTAAPAAPTSAPVQMIFGQSAAPLIGPWKFTVGDSPIDPRTGQPLWAEPEFDDSKWETVDLTPKEGEVNPITGQSSFVPGWTAKGHPGYWGYAWYRILVRARSQTGEPLALAGPTEVDDAYQLFSGGALVGSFGKFTGSHPLVYITQPEIFHLPESSAASDGERVLAFRFWMEPNTLIQESDPGGMHSAPVLGDSGVVALRYQGQWDELIRSYLSEAILAAVFALLAVVAFSLILFDRSDPVYLWIGLLFLAGAVVNAVVVTSQWSELVSYFGSLLIEAFMVPLIRALWAIVLWAWFGRAGFRGLPWIVAAWTASEILSIILSEELFYGLISHQVAGHLYLLEAMLRLVFFALLLWIVAYGIRRSGVEGWLVLPVVLLCGVGLFANELMRLHIPQIWFPFGIQVGINEIVALLSAAVLALLLLRRLLQSVKRQRQMALDVKSAQEVQQVILPEHRVKLSGFEIESEYRPAREVGGDFFQIIPNKDDGSLIIVAGDVAGKGLKAGMLVALLVGAIRTAADVSSDPVFVLDALNKRLLGRGDARATCLALRIDADGAAKLANAGHLPPYLNGSPVEIEGSLPLGIIEKPVFSLLEFRVAPNDRLLLLSDGIAEATDEEGKLFGFERVLELVHTRPSARQIAETALAFGQEDDISVISVARAPVAAPVTA
jgi:hypothetical protein